MKQIPNVRQIRRFHFHNRRKTTEAKTVVVTMVPVTAMPYAPANAEDD